VYYSIHHKIAFFKVTAILYCVAMSSGAQASENNSELMAE
jgi:hypothetical protein